MVFCNVVEYVKYWIIGVFVLYEIILVYKNKIK